jgi:hypothetical protein
MGNITSAKAICWLAKGEHHCRCCEQLEEHVRRHHGGEMEDLDFFSRWEA